MTDLPKVKFEDLKGESYEFYWNYQKEILQDTIHFKRCSLEERAEIGRNYQRHHLLFVEHTPVYTLGKSGSMDHLLLTPEEQKILGVEFFKINRGGDITYHGPGQITGYPIFDLEEFFTDVHKYVWSIEESIIQTLKAYGLESRRIQGFTGVWIPADERNPINRKICAIGVHMSRWVSMHGFAFNVNTDLSYFDRIVPCGIVDPDKGVTSLEKELGKKMDLTEVKLKLKDTFASVFNFEFE